MNEPCNTRSRHRIFHAGELEAHHRFGVVDEALEMSDVVVDRLSLGVRRFIESQPFFFIGTASDGNNNVACDIVMRLKDSQGRALRLLKVNDSKTLVFALPPSETSGEFGGYLLDGGGVGLLFIDFQRRVRYRVNGRVRPCSHDSSTEWPAACRIVEIAVLQAYGNCSARVVRLEAIPE